MMKRVAVIAWALSCAGAHAHSASDAYLTLDVGVRGNATVIEARWDIALRDLNFVLGLDDDGDGAVTWGEVKRHRAQIASYAYGRLRARSDRRPCAIEPVRQLISSRADGAYAALFFRIVCDGAGKVALDYRLFFDIDPTHRGIVVARSGDATATALMSPANARVELAAR
jgi:hypothetical protein